MYFITPCLYGVNHTHATWLYVGCVTCSILGSHAAHRDTHFRFMSTACGQPTGNCFNVKDVTRLTSAHAGMRPNN